MQTVSSPFLLPLMIFPMAMVPEENGAAKICYGVTDAVVAMATVRIEDLIDHCSGREKVRNAEVRYGVCCNRFPQPLPVPEQGELPPVRRVSVGTLPPKGKKQGE